MPTPVTTVEMGSPIHHWQGCPFPPIITVLLFLRPPRQLLPPSLEPIKRIKNPCTRNHLLNTLALLLLYKNNPSSTRKPDEVQPCSSLPCPAWKRGVSLAYLLVTASPAASGGEEPLSGGERRGARPECWRQIRSQRKEWKPVIFYTFFDGENRTFFGHAFSYLLLSRERLTVSVVLAHSLEGAFLQDFSLAPRAAVGTRLAAGDLVILLGPQGTGGTRDQAVPAGPWSRDWLSPHSHLSLILELSEPNGITISRPRGTEGEEK